jgi:hypothetical protein
MVSGPFDEMMIKDHSSLTSFDTTILSWSALLTDDRGIADLSILA